MWRNLNLRTRILLGYGLVLGLSAALALFLALRVGKLNSGIKQLNTSVTIEAQTGARVAAQVAATQRVVDRYLRQPQQEYFQSAQFSLQELTAEIGRTRSTLTGPSQRQRLDDLDQRLAAYLTTFQSLSTLIKAQEPIRNSLNTHLARSNTLLKGALADSLSGGAGSADVAPLNDAQASIQQANLWAARMTSEQSKTLAANALAELDKAKTTLTVHPGVPGTTIAISIANTLNEILLATSDTRQLQRNLDQVQQQRDTQLDEQGGALKQQADAIAQSALSSLTGATADLEHQTLQMQQIAAVALLLTLLLVVAVGVRLAQAISRPMNDLVVATTRLNQGDYEVTVTEQGAGEIGLLAAAFNRMTATLRQQRAEVSHQQEAAAERNRALERALAEIQAATVEREALARTMRQISVPVVPILDGVIVLPLVGEIDEPRAQALLRRLLDGVNERQARIAILDITGVPLVDAALARWLLKTADAAALLGAQCVLVGISPEVAQALVASGASLDRLTTRADLRSAVEYAMRATALRA